MKSAGLLIEGSHLLIYREGISMTPSHFSEYQFVESQKLRNSFQLAENQFAKTEKLIS